MYRISCLTRRLCALLCCLCLAQGLAPRTGIAAEPVRANGQPVITADTLKAKIDSLAQVSGQADDLKAKLLTQYRKALDHLATVEANTAQIRALIKTVETAPEESRRLKRAIAGLAERQHAGLPPPSPSGKGVGGLKDIEQELIKAKATAGELEARVADLTRQSAAVNERPARISQRLAEIKETQEKLQTAQKAPPTDTDPPELVEARSWAAQTQMSALHSEARLLNHEMASVPVTGELLNLNLQEASSRLDLARQQLQNLEAEVNRRRQAEAAQSLGQAKEVVAQMADTQPLLQQAAKENAEYSEQLLFISDALKATAAQRDSLDRELKKIEESFAGTRQKIAMAGLSQALGLLLHDQQRNLPSSRELARQLDQTREVIASTGLVQVQAGEERKKLDDIEENIRTVTAHVPDDQRMALVPALRPLLTSRADLLDKIIDANRTYLGQLSEIEHLTNSLSKTVDEYNRYLNERLLWIRSTPVLRLHDLLDLPGEFKTLVSPDPWQESGRLLLDQILVEPLFLLSCLLSSLLVALRRALIDRLENAVNLAGNPVTYTFALPLGALALSMLLALPLPLVLFTMGWLLHSHNEAGDFARIIGSSLVFIGSRYFFMRIIMILLRPVGVATRIFFWPKAAVSLLQRETGRFLRTFLPVVFFTQLAFYANFHTGGSHVLGRLSMLLVLAVITLFAFRLLHPKTGVWSVAHGKNPQHLSARLYPGMFYLGLTIPLAMAVLVLSGYLFAIGGLIRCLLNTIFLGFVLVVGHQLLARWLVQSSRQLALQKAWQQRAQNQPVVEGGQTAGERTVPAPEAEEDLAELSSDSRKLLNALVTLTALGGSWLVWAEMLPALGIFDQYTLWRHSAQVNGQVTLLPVTVADAGLTVLIGFLTLLGTRHLPSLLKIILLQRLQMTPGSRYTVVTLTRYLIGGAGILYIADVLGFSWSQIQWLVAALGVGIGFGLQEIVANFISGLIILFERPIRVGDVVSVDTTDGVVTRIRIRATTIRDFDGKELLVPNKEFIAGRLLN